ncbi:MAG: TrkH family potassium uptake protein [Desulfurococcaceae archaeon]
MGVGSMRAPTLALYVGSLLAVVGSLMLSVPIVDLLAGERILYSFLYASLACGAIGILLVALSLRARTLAESPLDAVIGYTVAWIAIILVAAIPLSAELGISYLDAVFETVSGFTGTGFTVLTHLDTMERGILFWRALMQWSGELGFATLAMVLLPFFWAYGSLLYNVERPARIFASLYRTARRFLGVYLFFTLAGTVATYYAGANLFDALTHTMTAIATGGMSNYDDGYTHVYDYAPLTAYPLMVIMFVGGMSFISMSYLAEGRLKEIWNSEEFRLYLFFVLGTSAAASLLFVADGMRWGDAMIYGFFNVISGITTTGFNLGNVEAFDPAIKSLLIIGMYVGGMTFSTAGGLKVARLLIIAKKLKGYAKETLIGSRLALTTVVVDGKALDEPMVSGALLFSFVHTAAVALGAFVAKAFMPWVDFLDAVFDATSAASCVGLSTVVAVPTAPPVVKLDLIALMLLGKLEYMPLVALIGLIAHRKVIKMVKP